MKQTYIPLAIVSLAVLLGMPSYGYAAGIHKNKMKACNTAADEKGLSGEGKGPERKAFMKECLSAKSSKAATGAASQQSKMKRCNKDAGAQNLKGDERKKFMSTCLSN
jgi:hypothetical protein